MGDIHRWELVEYTVYPPVDHHTIAKVLDQLRAELGDRWEYHDAATVAIADDGAIVFRYRKAKS
ncbi:hypothetical protein AB0L05_27805 [Nonomuraea pusilla]|uniref:hypothetical protein n=1 Tax=Nonomuraea pusilla TaxID=46177 RepID=UPI00331D752D